MQKGWSQSALARHSGVSQSAISALEKEKCTPTESTLKMLAASLGCSASDLLSEEKAADDKVSGLQEEAITLLQRLPESAQDQAVQYLRFLASQQEK